MKREISKAKRRIGVIANYASLIILLILFYSAEYLGWNVIFTIGIIAMFTVFLITYIKVQVKTGLWRLVHTKIEKLDEREIQVTHESLRYSYAIFSVICLAIMLIYSVAESGSISVLIVAGLIYLAHTLPSSVIAWTERKV